MMRIPRIHPYTSRLFIILGCIMLIACTATCVSASDLQYREKVVAGGPDHFMEVRHVYMKGSNFDIGKKLGEIAAGFGSKPLHAGDPTISRDQREYFERKYPILYQRMRGIAEYFGLRIDDDSYDFSFLIQFPIGQPGCSAVFYPGEYTENGHGILSRNFDFTTGTIMGSFPREGEMPVISRPYIFELHPDEGYASLAVCAFDFVGCVLDGINEQGLAVAIFGDDDSVVRYGLNPSPGTGLHELMSMRYLLDNCANAAEAKKALLAHKHFYTFVPCHYLIADREGNSFAFEISPDRKETHVVEGKGCQVITNHLLALYPSMEDFPAETQIDSFERYKILQAAVAGKKKFSIAEIQSIVEKAANSAMKYDSPDHPPGRTLWQSMYDTTERSLRIKFYLGDTTDPDEAGNKIAEYSEYVELSL